MGRKEAEKMPGVAMTMVQRGNEEVESGRVDGREFCLG
jgi:hypothetical protein